jgi:MFS family permease
MPNLLTPWRGVAAAFALNGVLTGVWASRIPAVVKSHGLTEGTLGIMLLAMGIGALVSFPIAGRFADGYGAVKMTRLLAVAAVVAMVLVGFAPGTILLGIALFLFGMAYGSMDVTMNSWATEVEKQMGRAVMSSFHAMWSLGAGVGAATGFAATSLGLSVPVHFTIMALLVPALLGPFLRVPWTSAIRPHEGSAPVFALPRGALVLVGFIALAAGLGEGAVADWSAVYLREIIGATEARATLGYAIYSITMVGMRLCVDRLVTRWGPPRVARISGLSATIGIVLVTMSPSLPMTLAGFVLMGIGYAALIPLAFSRAAADPVVPPGQGIASIATFAYGAMLIGPPVIGLIAELSSLRVAFMLLGGAALLVAVLAPALERRFNGVAAPAE